MRCCLLVLFGVSVGIICASGAAIPAKRAASAARGHKAAIITARAQEGTGQKKPRVVPAPATFNATDAERNAASAAAEVLGCTTPILISSESTIDIDRARVLQQKYNIAMYEEEVAFLSSLLQQPNTKTYFEYGMGGSTRLACHIGGDRLRIYAVDSAIEWVRRVNSTECVQRGARQGRITVRAVNIGPVGAWGTPSGNSTRHLWPRYSRAISSIKDPIDVVLVDGRFRVACALNTFLHHPEATVLLHDAERFLDYGAPYAALCEVAERVAVASRLLELRLKPNVSADRLKELISIYELESS